MRKILLSLFAVFALCPYSGPAASPEEPPETPPAGKEVRETALARIENWDFILSKLDSQITRADQILATYQPSSQEIGPEYVDFTNRIYMQADELRVLLSVCAPQDVFEITLRCQQIDDLYVIFRRRYDMLKAIRDASVELTARTEAVRSELDRMSALPQYHRYEARIRAIMAKYQAFRDKANWITSALDSFLNPSLEKMMTDLVAEAAKARTDTIDHAFFSRQMAYWQLLPSVKQIMAYWYYTSMDAKQFTGNGLTRGDYLCFLAIFVPLLILFLLTGPRWIYPWLLKQARFPDKYRKSKLFFVAGMLLVLAVSL